MILCVDDEPTVLDALKKQIRHSFRNNLLVEVAQSGEEGLELFQELISEGYNIPIVIADYRMPGGITGDVFLQSIHKIDSSPLNILLTGQANIEGIQNAVNNASLFRYLVKPWSNEELSFTIRQAMTNYRQTRDIVIKRQELMELTASLEKKVVERTKELAESNLRLQESNQQKDNLMAVVAHDLRAPLNKISGILELIDVENSKDNQKTYVELGQKIVQNGYELIRNLLEIHAYDDSELEINNENINLLEFFEEQYITFEKTAALKNIKIIIQPQSKPIVVKTDRHFLERIVNNLFSNAIKFSNLDKNIYVDFWENESNFYLSIKDEGQGMTEDDLGKLFQKFQKLSARPTSGESSTGLGLAIIKSLVDKLDGTIQVQSEVNVGTEFVICIPQ